MARIHVTPYGTYHPDPLDQEAWTYDYASVEAEVVCDQCGRPIGPDEIFALHLNGGDALCTDCADAVGIEVVDCDC